MFELSRIFGRKNQAPSVLDKDKIAALLRVDPDALARFEAAYAAGALSEIPDGVFDTNSRQAAQMANAVDPSCPISFSESNIRTARDLTNRIAARLLPKTAVYAYDPITGGRTLPPFAMVPDAAPISQEEIMALPEQLRPQLTDDLMHVDCDADTAETVLFMYAKAMDPKTPAKLRKHAYQMFRQGLDVADLDALTYEIIGTNKNSIGFWFPKLVEAAAGQDFFRIPATRIAKVPMTMLQLTHCDWFGLTRTTKDIVNRWAMTAFGLDTQKEYFIKTGTYSSKFDFRNAKVTGANEIKELGEYLLYIHFQALQMASPLATPCIYGVSTTNEWVVREFISDSENNPSIYKGMPLHTEYRVFVDCNTDQIIGYSPYWEPGVMKSRFSQHADANSPHQIHDYVIYQAHEEKLMGRYQENLNLVLDHVREILPKLDLPGQWSLDIMQNGNDFWLIDMALAENSAFYEIAVPPALRRPLPENWIPKLPGGGTSAS